MNTCACGNKTDSDFGPDAEICNACLLTRYSPGGATDCARGPKEGERYPWCDCPACEAEGAHEEWCNLGDEHEGPCDDLGECQDRHDSEYANSTPVEDEDGDYPVVHGSAVRDVDAPSSSSACPSCARPVFGWFDVTCWSCAAKARVLDVAVEAWADGAKPLAQKVAGFDVEHRVVGLIKANPTGEFWKTAQASTEKAKSLPAGVHASMEYVAPPGEPCSGLGPPCLLTSCGSCFSNY